MSKALELLGKSKTVRERADSYVVSMKRNLQKKILDTLQDKIDAIKDKNFDLENFTLDTNLNAGVRQMSKEDCESRFEQLINNQFELQLLEAELKVKQEAFNQYFNENVSAEQA
jgi:hypothetical protein